MNDAERPEGELFSSVYVDPGEPAQDSKRMRRRLGALLNDLRPPNLDQRIEVRLGIDVAYSDWKFVLEKFDLKDVLDTVTLAYRSLAAVHYADAREGRFVKAVNIIFREENVYYEVDQRGGVHFSVDKEFARNQAATLARLGAPRYANARQNFEQAQENLSQVPADGKGAIRAIFDAAENLFRLMFPNEPSLKANQAVAKLKGEVQRLYDGNAPAQAAAVQQVTAFGNWVDACHHYRHEHKGESVMPPPLDLAVQLVSSGATYIRWLAELDVRRSPPSPST
jgi:hypothetical protein